MSAICEIRFKNSEGNIIDTGDLVFQDACPPLPSVGEEVFLAGFFAEVVERQFEYGVEDHQGETPKTVVRIDIYCKLKEQR